MSYCFDVMSRAWAELRDKLPEEARYGEAAIRFEILINAMHEANRRLGDAINHDETVSVAARRLDHSNKL
jgi:hypothetical protein